MSRIRRPFRTRIAAAATGLLALTLAGCVPGYYAGGSLASLDLYTYESTPDYPQTVTLVDTSTGEKIWSVDIPVGKQLVIRFAENKAKGDKSRPDVMRWEIMQRDTTSGVLDNSIPVPPAWQRRVDVTLRSNSAVPQRPATAEIPRFEPAAPAAPATEPAAEPAATPAPTPAEPPIPLPGDPPSSR